MNKVAFVSIIAVSIISTPILAQENQSSNRANRELAQQQHQAFQAKRQEFQTQRQEFQGQRQEFQAQRQAAHEQRQAAAQTARNNHQQNKEKRANRNSSARSSN